VLAPNVPINANYNPGGAEIDPRRNAVSGGFTLPKSYGVWSGLVSYAHSSTDALRGFVTDPTGPVFPAIGERSTTAIDEVYADAHVELTNVAKTQIVAGADYQYGKGHLNGGDFGYTINADGSNPQDGTSVPLKHNANITDTRNFGGLYGFVAWTPDWRWRLEGGLRWNLTDESRDTSVVDFLAATSDQGSDSVSESRLGGSAGVTFTAWQKGVDNVRIFTDYRNTYKPAAVDFGLDAEAEILDPETSESWELGVRTGLFDRKLELEFSAFDMELHNLVVPTLVNGLPALENAGAERFQGVELEASGHLPYDIVLRAAGSYHDAKFLDYVRDFDGVPTQLAGKRQASASSTRPPRGLSPTRTRRSPARATSTRGTPRWRPSSRRGGWASAGAATVSRSGSTARTSATSAIRSRRASSPMLRTTCSRRAGFGCRSTGCSEEGDAPRFL